jgi:WD40 repeat protein
MTAAELESVDANLPRTPVTHFRFLVIPTAVAFHPTDPKCLLSASLLTTLFYSIEMSEARCFFFCKRKEAHSYSLLSLTPRPAGTEDGKIAIWDASEDTSCYSDLQEASCVMRVAWSSDGKWFGARPAQKIFIYKQKNPYISRYSRLSRKAICDGLAAVAHKSGAIGLWKFTNWAGVQYTMLKFHTGEVYDVLFVQAKIEGTDKCVAVSPAPL